MEVRHSLFPAVIILLCVSFGCFAMFTVTPSSVTIEVEHGVEQVAMFTCRHERIGAHIGWLINRTTIQQYRDVLVGSFRDIDDSLVQTLAIPAIPRYNESEIVCVATFLDGSPHEETPPVALIISGTVSTTVMPTARATTTPPATPTMPAATLPPTTTLPPPATPPLPTIPIANFTVIPTSQNKTVEQKFAVFHCQHRSCDDIVWNVNNLSGNNVTKTRLSGGGFNSSLTIETGPALNGSTVQCICIFFRNTLPEYSAPVTLHVQGIPGEVNDTVHERNYSLNAITTRWTPSPSLDLTDINPDIMYGVQLLMITCGKNVSISKQNVSGNSVTSEGLDLMQIYEIIIAARNNVPDAQSGPSVMIEESFMSLDESTIFTLARESQVIMTISDPIPSFFTLILNSIDGYGFSLVTNITVTRNEQMVTMQMEHAVPTMLLLNASIMAYGCDVHTETIDELSTHDVQNVSATSPLPGMIRVIGDFVDGSTADGVLLITYSLSDESDVCLQYGTKERNKLRIAVDVTSLTGSEYGVSVFASYGGLPFPRVVTLPQNVAVGGDANNRDDDHVIKYEAAFNSTGVCITCIFLDDSTTDCLVVVHQRISQLSSSGLMNIVSSHRFNRSGDTAYGCVEKKLEEYFIGVIDGQLVTDQQVHRDYAGYVAAGVIAGFFLLSVIPPLLIFIVFILLKIKKKKTIGVKQNYDHLSKSEEGCSQRLRNVYSPMPTGTETIEMSTYGSIEVDADPIIVEEEEESMPLYKKEEADTIAHDATSKDSEEVANDITPADREDEELRVDSNANAGDREGEAREMGTCEGKVDTETKPQEEEPKPVVIEDETGTRTHGAAIEDRVEDADETTPADTEVVEEDETGTKTHDAAIQDRVEDANEVVSEVVREDETGTETHGATIEDRVEDADELTQVDTEVVREDETGTETHGATIEDSVHVEDADEITQVDTEVHVHNEAQAEDMNVSVEESEKDAEEESHTVFLSKDGIVSLRLTQPIGHSTPQRRQSCSNETAEIEPFDVRPFSSHDNSLIVHNSQVHERLTHAVEKSLTYCTYPEDSSTNPEEDADETGASENSTCSSATQARPETEGGEQNGHEPVGDSAYHTVSVPGDLESRSTLNSDVNESEGSSRVDTEGIPVKPAETFVSGYNSSSSSSVQDGGGMVSSSPMFTNEPMMDQRHTALFTAPQENEPAGELCTANGSSSVT